MKTIKEWLSDLPEPYRTQALYNMDAYGNGGSAERNSVGEALAGAFMWERSAEGYKYWCTLADEGVFPYAGQIEAPANALSAIHAIALKKGFPAEEIMSIQYNAVDENWHYQLKEDTGWTTINLSNDKSNG